MSKWMPAVGATIPVYLPQEIVRGEVKEYLDDDTLIASLNVQPPLSKGHNYRFRQNVKLFRQRAEPAGECWKSEDAIDAA